MLQSQHKFLSLILNVLIYVNFNVIWFVFVKIPIFTSDSSNESLYQSTLGISITSLLGCTRKSAPSPALLHALQQRRSGTTAVTVPQLCALIQ